MSRSGTAFGRYSMSGGRFEEAEGLPLSAISELKNYKDLIDDVAARLYKREHPRKKNLPSGFSRDIDIRLTGIKHGCVVVEMTRYQHETSNQIPLWDEDAPDFAETARKMINSTIRSIKQAKDPASIGDFPPESLSRLYRLGKSLNEDEKITLAEADNSGRIDVDSDWKDIISRSTESQFVERVIDGKLVGMDASEEWFTYTFLIYTSQKIIRGKADINRWDDSFNFLLFLFVLFILGLFIKENGFTHDFLCLSIIGQGLNIFDLFIVDLLWWRNTKRVRLRKMPEKELYQNPKKHIEAFIRAFIMYLLIALIDGYILTLL